jgi:hypothetical protein
MNQLFVYKKTPPYMDSRTISFRNIISILSVFIIFCVWNNNPSERNKYKYLMFGGCHNPNENNLFVGCHNPNENNLFVGCHNPNENNLFVGCHNPNENNLLSVAFVSFNYLFIILPHHLYSWNTAHLANNNHQ